MRYGLLLLLICLATPAAAQSGSFAEQRAEWNAPVEPFRIAGNIYSVGTAGIAVYFIADKKGHVLIDGGMEESAARIAANIRRLGYRVEDIKYILNNHAHWDHSGGIAELKRLSGAKLLASVPDRPGLETGKLSYRDDIPGAPPVTVDVEIMDGSRVKVGRSALRMHLTPGHTKGCTSWTMRVREKGRPLDILFACSLTVAGQPLLGHKGYPEAERDFRATFAKLRRLKADIFLGFHPNGFDMAEKRRKVVAGDANAFVDRGELKRRVDQAEAAFEAELQRQRSESAR